MDIYQKIKNLNFPIDKYVVIGGSALEGYGIRKGKDIDICVTEDLYKELKTNDWKEVVEPDGQRTLKMGQCELAVKWGFKKYDISVNSLIKGSMVINGVRFVGLSDLIDYKKVTNREKDRRDILLIQKYLQNRIK